MFNCLIMKRNIAILIIFSFFTLFTISCVGLLTPISPNVMDIEAVQYTSSGMQIITNFTVEKIMSERNFDVYLKRGLTINTVKLTNQVKKFATVYNTIVETFGKHSDVDKNEKILIIFFDINSGAARGSYIGGYFNPLDLIAGNAAEIIYLDALNGSDSWASTMVHELQHLINFNQNYQKQSDLWANEALSAAAEIVYEKKIPDERINYFNNDKGRLIRNGDYFYSWLDGGSLADYATVSLFMYWLYVQGGEDIFYYIANAPIVDRGSLKAFEYAARIKINVLLTSWEEILKTWYTANIKNEKSGLHGYLGYVYPIVYAADDGSKKLYPGDVVYSDKNITGGTEIVTPSKTVYYYYNEKTKVHTSSNEPSAMLSSVSVDVSKSSSEKLSSMSSSSSRLYASKSYNENTFDGPYKKDAIIYVDTRTGKGLNETNK